MTAMPIVGRAYHNDASAIISWHIPQRGLPWQSCCLMRRARKAVEIGAETQAPADIVGKDLFLFIIS